MNEEEDDYVDDLIISHGMIFKYNIWKPIRNKMKHPMGFNSDIDKVEPENE